jgi:DNA-binding transcriptional MerR regulator
MHTLNPKLRMHDLVQRTGFTERRIRFYIVQGLVPGAERKGPDATYDQATLDRLLLIRELKDKKVAPTNRKLRLDEIRETLTALGEEGARYFADNPQALTIVDTEPRRPPRFARTTEADLRDDWLGRVGRPTVSDTMKLCVRSAEGLAWRSHAASPPPPIDLGDLGALLRRVLNALESLSSSVAVKGDAAATSWRRLAVDDLEFQVREPADLDASRRLGRYAAALRTLLSPYPESDD